MPLWQPSPARIEASRLTEFARAVGADPLDYATLYRRSVADVGWFWSALWDFCGVVGDRGHRAVVDLDRFPGARFFPDARLNFTENLLRDVRSNRPAIVSQTEHGDDRTITFDELARDVARVAAALGRSGVRSGDRVAAIVSNIPEAIIAALGTAAVGAVWSSCSPDFGVQGVIDRFGQIGPVLLLAVDGYHYGGKTYDCLSKLADITPRLPSVRQTVIIPAVGDVDTHAIPRSAARWADWLGDDAVDLVRFERFAFNHPLYILYSSGTTGVPKCIAHGAGGTLLQHLKEHQLHCDIKSGDRVFYFTTCGWMMWNWLITALASGATLVLYDGSPFYPDGHRLFDLADAARTTLFGVSAENLDAVRKADLTPGSSHDLSSVRTITSTGSPLSPECFEFVYQRIKGDVHLASISGGTDIVSLFVGGNPNAPVHAGEIQCACLGMDVDIFDHEGRPSVHEPGELVCKTPFPSMPLGFWNDPEDVKYRAAYFERYPGVWWHGDWAAWTPYGGLIIYGRSDATLNPGGVRIGTAEIYRQVEQFPEVLESLAVGQQWEGDERIVLFVRLRDGLTLDDELRRRLAAAIRANTSPRHVPARIVQVADIPRTKSGKIVEIAVRQVIHGRAVKNREALANPESLDLYRDVPELRS